jgi:uncharacterized protein YegL
MSRKEKKSKKSSKKTTVVTTTTTTTTTTTEVDKIIDTHYLLVLDRSGSMSSCWNSTIEGLNEQLGTIRHLDEKYPEQKYYVSLVVFDTEIDTIIENKPISEIENFDGTEFPPRGGTSLNDAMGYGISQLQTTLKKKAKKDILTTALVVVMTDGGENSSKEYSGYEGKAKIKEMIDKLEEDGSWTFSFMGANQDAVLTASGYGIDSSNSITYASTTRGAKVAFDTLNSAISAKASFTNTAYATASATGDVSLTSMNLDNTKFFSSVVEGDTIGEDVDLKESEDTDSEE